VVIDGCIAVDRRRQTAIMNQSGKISHGGLLLAQQSYLVAP